jgi:hypothetical protein
LGCHEILNPAGRQTIWICKHGEPREQEEERGEETEPQQPGVQAEFRLRHQQLALARHPSLGESDRQRQHERDEQHVGRYEPEPDPPGADLRFRLNALAHLSGC